MITCPSCGNANEEASIHCGFCGHRLREVQAPKQTMLGMSVSDEMKKQYKALISDEGERPRATLLMGAAKLAPAADQEVENPLLSTLPKSQQYKTLDGWPSPLKYTLEEIVGGASVPPRRGAEALSPALPSAEALAETWEGSRAAIHEAMRQEEPETLPGGEADPWADAGGESEPGAVTRERSEEALADTLEASRAQLREQIEAAEVAPVRSTVPARAVPVDLSVRGGARTEVLASDRSTDHVRRVVKAATPEVEASEVSPRGFQMLQWLLLGLLCTFLLGAIALGIVYFVYF